jgi:hypothetical protein
MAADGVSLGRTGLLMVAVAAVLMLAAGCESTPPSNSAPGAPVEQLPWNTPAGWENSVIGVPY